MSRTLLLRCCRPVIPLHCPPFLRSLITRCWDADPTKRPSFVMILDILRDNLDEDEIAAQRSDQYDSVPALYDAFAHPGEPTSPTTLITDSDDGDDGDDDEQQPPVSDASNTPQAHSALELDDGEIYFSDGV
jgi:hypothetical protein